MTSSSENQTELGRALDHCRALLAQPVEDKERAAAERLFVDTIGCAMGGISDPVASRVLTALPEYGDGVSILGHSKKVLPADALLVHAAAIRCLDYNDVFSRRNNHHPSEFVVPIIMALAEIEGWSGERIIDATAKGYRLFLAMGEMWEGLLGRGWAPASTLGRPTAAALVCILRSASLETTLNAMAIAAITAPTLGVVFKGELSGMKSLVNGMAARAGWEAAELAAAGISGPGDALEGVAGFDAMAGGAFSLPDPGSAMLTASDVSIKVFPTVFMIHSAIAAAVALSSRLKGAPRRVVVHAPEKAVSMSASEKRWAITSRESAQFSLPLSVATALVHGRCGMAELEPDLLNGAAVQAVLSVMSIEIEPEWTGYIGGRVSVETADGQAFSHEVMEPPGHPDNPATTEQLLEKFRALTSDTFEDDSSKTIAETALALGSAPGMGDLFAAALTGKRKNIERPQGDH